MYPNMRIYAVIDIKDLDLIDFSQIEETSRDTIRKSLDNKQFVIKWENGYTPTFISDGTVVPVGIYNHAEILEIMATAEWSQLIEE